MKTEKLKNGLICVSVPKEWERFYIDTAKSIGYFENNMLGFFDPNILMLPHIQILGTITKDECSFDCSEYVEKEGNNYHGFAYHNYLKRGKENDFQNPIDSFKSMIEAETEFLFENKPEPIGSSDPNAIDDYIEEYREWEYNQSRVIEKLLMLKTI